MAYNPWSKRPPVLPEVSRNFQLKSGDSICLTFRKQGIVQQTELYELQQTLLDRYIRGDAEFQESNGSEGDPPMTFPALGGVLVEPTETMIQGAAYIYCMQSGPVGDRITPEDWIAFQVVEDASDWVAVQAFAREVNRMGRPTTIKAADVPLGSGTDTNPS